jgi:glycosyltransferase involved in cell wall biosynthesis
VQVLAAAGCGIVDLKMDRRGLNPVRDAMLAMRFRRHFAWLKPDAVLSFTIKNNLFGAVAARSLGIPFIPNVTGLGTAFLGGQTLRLVAHGLYRAAFARLPIVFLQNADDRDLFVAQGIITSAQARLLPGSGIDLAGFAAEPYPADSEPVRYLMIARLLRDKGVLEYVEAARILAARGISARCQLLGAIDMHNRTAIGPSLLAEWRRSGIIEYLGTTGDVRPAIAQAHCIVLPSYREGAPRTLIESAAMARPGIGSAVPGCTAVIDHGVTGYLCAVRDGPALADAMAAFAALDAPERETMARAARIKAEAEFDVRFVVDAYRAALCEVLRRDDT